MNTLIKLTTAIGNRLARVNPIPPDENNVPTEVHNTVTKLVSGISWLMVAGVFLAAIVFLGQAAMRPKSRGSYLTSSVVAFAIGAFMATPSGQAYVQNTVEFFIKA